MGGVTGETNGSLLENNVEKETVNGQPNKDVIFGELLFVKLRETSWWPAQAVDENSVSSVNKPSNKSSNDVLVRLYGSYIYKYVDINGSRAEFKNVLIENNFDYNGIMKKSLEQDLPSLNSSRSKKRQQSKSKGSVKDASDKSQKKVSNKKQKQESKTKNKTGGVHHDTDPSSPNTEASLRSEELSARRIKVMQNLGLVAPLGSPFPR